MNNVLRKSYPLLTIKPGIFKRLIGLIRIGFYIVLGIWIVSCKSNESPDYLAGTPCVVPCWQGITPGITDEMTALKIVQDSQVVEQDSIITGTNSVRYYRTDGGSGRISIKDGIVYKVEIRPAPKQLTLGEAIDAFGAPEFIYIKTNLLEFSCVDINLLYPQKGLIIKSGFCGENNIVYENIEVSESMEVFNISLFEPNADIESFLIQSQLKPEIAHNIAQYAKPWIGFGSYTRLLTD